MTKKLTCKSCGETKPRSEFRHYDGGPVDGPCPIDQDSCTACQIAADFPE